MLISHLSLQEVEGKVVLVRANKVTAVQLTLLDFIKVRRRLSAVFMPSKQFFLRTVEDVSSRET